MGRVVTVRRRVVGVVGVVRGRAAGRGRRGRRGRPAAGRRRRSGRRASPPRGRPAAPAGRARGPPARPSRPGALSSPRVSASTCWLARSTPAVGSSRNSRSGCPASARAISTRCCWPPESVETPSRARSARPTTSRASSTAARSARDSGRSSRRRDSRPEATTSRTEAGTPDAAPGALRDEADALPVVELRRRGCRRAAARRGRAGRSPITVRTSVDLPEPLAPSRATTSPAGTVRSMPRRTGRPPIATAPSAAGRRWGRSSPDMRWPSAGRRGWRASGRGSPRRRSRRSGPRSGRAPRSSTPRSSASASVNRWAGEALGEDGGDALVADQLLKLRQRARGSARRPG